MADKNLIQVIITAKDKASDVFSKLFNFIDRTTSATANRLRDAFAGIFGGGIDEAVAFEAQLDRVAAKGGYTAQEMQDLADSARAIGAQFGVSGTEAGKALEALSAAGLSAKEAIGALPSVLALAASEQISADAAAQKLIDSLSVMGLGFEETGRMADVLAKGANITTSSASQLAEALTEAGGMARAAGMDLETTVAALDLLHKNGIKGAEAGTALKGILTTLQDPASKAGQELNNLGIYSRNLGTVLDGLKEQGGRAETAILAFGTEAGPGLRALLQEGKTGLDNYITQLRDSNGAAADAAAQMGGNLQSALNSLNSIWTSLKASMIEPLLEPIAQQAKALTAAFQEAIQSGAIKEVQTLLGQFGTRIADGIARLIREFDFKTAANAVGQFAQDAKAQFDTVAAVGTATAGTIRATWNALTAPIKAIVASIAQTIGYLFETLASVEQQAAKIGLGTVEKAEELMRKAQAAKDTAANVMAAAKQDVAELAAGATTAAGAFNQTENAAAGVNRELDQMKPPDLGNAQTLEPIRYSLNDYAGLLGKARQAQIDAADAADEAQHSYLAIGQLYDQGKVSLYAYEEAQRKDKIAQDDLRKANEALTKAQRDNDVAVQDAIRGIDAESTASLNSIKAKADLYAAQKQQLIQAEKAADASAKTAAAAVKAAEAELQLAQASGNQQTIRAAEIALAEKQLKALQAQRAEQEVQLKQYQATAARIADLLTKKDQLSTAEAAELQQLQQSNQTLTEVIAAKQQDIAATDAQIRKKEQHAQTTGTVASMLRAAGEDEIEIARLQALAAGDLTTALKLEEQQRRANIATTREQSKEATKQVREIDNTVAALKGIQDYYEKSLNLMQQLSDAAKHYYEMNFAIELSHRGIEGAAQDSLQKLQEWNAGLDNSSAVMMKYREEINNGWASIRQGREAMQFAMNYFAEWEAAVDIATGKTKVAFYEQATAAEELRSKLENIAQSGSGNLRTVEQAARAIRTEFNLLDEQDLQGLQKAIDNANGKLREMQQETEDARTKLAEMNAELLEAQGMDQKAEILRQQLSYEQQLAEIDAKLAEAQAAHNTELVRILNQQKTVLEDINRTKLKNIEAEAAAATAADKTEKATRTLASHASDMERISQAMSSMAGLNFGQVEGQFNSIATAATQLRDVL